MSLLPLEGFDPSRSPSPAASPGVFSTQYSSPSLTDITTQGSTPAGGDVYDADGESEVSTDFEDSPGKYCNSLCYFHHTLTLPDPEPTPLDGLASRYTFGPESNVAWELGTVLYVDACSKGK
jgi:hypothetical protein